MAQNGTRNFLQRVSPGPRCSRQTRSVEEVGRLFVFVLHGWGFPTSGLTLPPPAGAMFLASNYFRWRTWRRAPQPNPDLVRQLGYPFDWLPPTM